MSNTQKDKAIRDCLNIIGESYNHIVQLEMNAEEHDDDEYSKVTSWFLKNLEGFSDGVKNYYGIAKENAS